MTPILFLSLFVLPTLAQLPPLGQVSPSIACLAAPDQTYAIYLPSNYSPERRWPLVLCLEPMSRGKIPVEGFAAAAEKWGYVVIGSNNSRNYDWSTTTHAVNAIIAEAQTRYAIDFQRIYHAGFSGGARASCDLALMAKKAAGVIAFGSGFNSSRLPNQFNKVDFVGVIGQTDMNFLELTQLDRTLTSLGWNHKHIVFEGGHQWPEPPTFTKALAWMELQWLRRTTPADQATRVMALFQEATASATRLESENKPYMAWAEWAQIVQEFKGLVDTSTAKAAFERLDSNQEVQKIRQRKDAIERKELPIAKVYHERIDQLRLTQIKPASRASEKKWWLKKNEGLINLPEDPEERLMIERLREVVYNGIYEVALISVSDGQFEHAAFVADLSSALCPQEGGPLFTLAQAQAELDQNEEAVATLEKMAKITGHLGQYVRNDPHLARLKDHAPYQALLLKYPAPPH